MPNPHLNIVLVAPEIPQNTGNIIRLCANTGAKLYLVKPLGFNLDDSSLRRAYLDYKDLAQVVLLDSIDSVFYKEHTKNIYSTVPNASKLYTEPKYEHGDTIIFGSESNGLPKDILDKLDPENCLRIPMMPNNRSVNLSNAVSIMVYEVWRQLGFKGAPNNPTGFEGYFS